MIADGDEFLRLVHSCIFTFFQLAHQCEILHFLVKYAVIAAVRFSQTGLKLFEYGISKTIFLLIEVILRLFEAQFGIRVDACLLPKSQECGNEEANNQK